MSISARSGVDIRAATSSKPLGTSVADDPCRIAVISARARCSRAMLMDRSASIAASASDDASPCYEKQVDVLMGLLDDGDLVRRWFADGMLDNVVAVLGVKDAGRDWARILSSD